MRAWHAWFFAQRTCILKHVDQLNDLCHAWRAHLHWCEIHTQQRRKPHSALSSSPSFSISRGNTKSRAHPAAIWLFGDCVAHSKNCKHQSPGVLECGGRWFLLAHFFDLDRSLKLGFGHVIRMTFVEFHFKFQANGFFFEKIDEISTQQNTFSVLVYKIQSSGNLWTKHLTLQKWRKFSRIQLRAKWINQTLTGLLSFWSQHSSTRGLEILIQKLIEPSSAMSKVKGHHLNPKAWCSHYKKTKDLVAPLTCVFRKSLQVHVAV